MESLKRSKAYFLGMACLLHGDGAAYLIEETLLQLLLRADLLKSLTRETELKTCLCSDGLQAITKTGRMSTTRLVYRLKKSDNYN